MKVFWQIYKGYSHLKHPLLKKRITATAARLFCVFLKPADMRGLTRGVVSLCALSFLLALLHSCSLDNGILKPSCLIFEVDLNEKWWYPQDNTSRPLYFRNNGLLMIEGQTDSVTFILENCNKLAITNKKQFTEEQWVIKYITDTDLQLQYPDDKLVTYLRKK